MNRRPLRMTVAAGAIAVALWPGVARSQSKEDVARADALFNAGKALTDAGQYAEACGKFAESKRLAPGVGVTLYLADCYQRIGRTASAWTEFRSAEGAARGRSDKRAEVARGRAQALEPTLDRLTITVAPTVPQAGLQVLRDGIPVAREELGLPIPVDPGEHAVVVSAPGHPPKTFAASLRGEGQSVTVAVDRLEEAEPGPAPMAGGTLAAAGGLPAGSRDAGSNATSAAPGDGPRSTDSHGVTPRRRIALGLGALGVVGVGLGTAFGVAAKVNLDQSNGGPCNSTDHCDTHGQSLRQTAGAWAGASNIGFLAGGALLAAGVILYVTAPRPQSPIGVAVTAAPIAGGGGALLRTVF